MGAARKTLKKLKVQGYAVQVEISFLDWDSSSYHPHCHIIADVPIGGRNFVPEHAWANEFYNLLPNSLHPTTGSVKVEDVIDEPFRVCDLRHQVALLSPSRRRRSPRSS